MEMQSATAILLEPREAIVAPEQNAELATAVKQAEETSKQVDGQLRELDQLEASLQRYPAAARAAASDIALARQSLGSGHPAPMIVANVENKLNDEQMREAQQAVLGGVLAVASMAQIGPLGATLFKHHDGQAGMFAPNPELVQIVALSNASHFTPAVNPGMAVGLMQSLDRGMGLGGRSLSEAKA